MVRKIALAGVGVVVALTLAVTQSPANATTTHTAAPAVGCVLRCPI